MSLRAVQQLYEDIILDITANPQASANQALADTFNAILKETKKTFPDNPIISAIKESYDTELLSDLVPRLGQVKVAWEDASTKP
jgi:hypothetical protein